MTIPMIVGQMGASIIIGQLVSRFGKWKGWMMLGSVLALVGVSLMSTLRWDTPFILVATYMFVLGAGLGMVMQNLTLIVQNDTPPRQLGAASSGVNFFRTIAGTIGVTIMGSILATNVGSYIKDDLSTFVPKSPEEVSALKSLGSGNVPDMSSLPESIRRVVESAYGLGIADAFIVAVPLAVIGVIAIAFIRNKPLSTKNSAEQLREQAEGSAIEVAEAEVGGSTGSIRVVENDGRVREQVR
jgi:MFS family permease